MELYLHPQDSTDRALMRGGVCLGRVRLTINPFHSAHRELRLALEDWDEKMAPEIIAFLRRQCPEPLKYMVESTDQARIRFLRAGGFRLARRCFVREFPRHWCKTQPQRRLCPSQAHRGQPLWDLCAGLLHQKYIRQHEAISPLTGTRAQFLDVLPETVWLEASDGDIRHFAFVEENEIAYVWSADPDSRAAFLETVLHQIFSQFDTVTFEADEHDADAMALRPFFEFWGNYAYNTYLLD